jgi:hypothetical protein
LQGCLPPRTAFKGVQIAAGRGAHNGDAGGNRVDRTRNDLPHSARHTETELGVEVSALIAHPHLPQKRVVANRAVGHDLKCFLQIGAHPRGALGGRVGKPAGVCCRPMRTTMSSSKKLSVSNCDRS